MYHFCAYSIKIYSLLQRYLLIQVNCCYVWHGQEMHMSWWFDDDNMPHIPIGILSALRKSKIIKLVAKLKELEIIFLKMITESHKDQCHKFLETLWVCLVKDQPESQKLSWWSYFVMKLYPDLYNFPLRATTVLFKWSCIFLMNQKGL